MRFKLLIFILVLMAVSAAWAQMPKKLSYQGVLTDTTGAPKADGNYTVTFSLYNAATGGVTIWSKTLSVGVKGGLFSVILDLDASIQFNAPYYLGIKVGSDPELTPRVELTAAGYSFRALRADSAAYVNGAGITNLNASNLSSGTVPTARLDPDLQDLEDGTLTGSKVGTGINAANITTGFIPAARLSNIVADSIKTGTLSGARVGSGINASNITTGTLSNARLPTAISQTTVEASDYMAARDGINVGSTSDPNGNLLVSSGSVGIGTTAPEAPLDVETDASGYAIHLEETSTETEDWLIGVDVDGDLNFYNGIGVTTLELLDGNYLRLNAGGASINEFSTDATLAGNSNYAVPTEYAVKTYVDGRRAAVTVLNGSATSLSSITTTYTKISDYGSFTKIHSNSIVEITYTGRISVATMTGNACYFQIWVDDAAPYSLTGIGDIRLNEAGDQVRTSMQAIFTSLATGTHTVNMYVRTSSGTGTTAYVNSGNYTARFVVKELP